MRKIIFIILFIIPLAVAGCSSPVNAATVPVRPTLAPTRTPIATPVPETCFVDAKGSKIQISVTGVDIQEYCTSIIDISPEWQTLGDKASTESLVCSIEIDPGVMLEIRSDSLRMPSAQNLCGFYTEISATSTPQP
jgi:hypothetical protein